MKFQRIPSPSQSGRETPYNTAKHEYKQQPGVNIYPKVSITILTGSVNFKKGCYTGQEIIARLHWRGTPKRRLYIAAGGYSTNNEAPAPGTPLFTGDKSQSIGSIVNACSTPEGFSALIETTEDGFQQGLYLEGATTQLQQSF